MDVNLVPTSVAVATATFIIMRRVAHVGGKTAYFTTTTSS
jgi:hypothetical protein